MTGLRQRMIEDMRLAGLADRTQSACKVGARSSGHWDVDEGSRGGVEGASASQAAALWAAF